MDRKKSEITVTTTKFPISKGKSEIWFTVQNGPNFQISDLSQKVFSFSFTRAQKWSRDDRGSPSKWANFRFFVGASDGQTIIRPSPRISSVRSDGSAELPPRFKNPSVPDPKIPSRTHFGPSKWIRKKPEITVTTSYFPISKGKSEI